MTTWRREWFVSQMPRWGQVDTPLSVETLPISMGPDVFLDGRTFDPADVRGYVEGFEVRAPGGTALLRDV